MTVIAFPSPQREKLREPTIEELAAAYLEGWQPPRSWSVDENDVVYLNDAEYREAAAFWAAHGFAIERTGPLESYMEGWAYLAAQPQEYIHYLQKYPKTYTSLTRAWSADDHAYIDALIAGDLPSIAALAPLTIFARELREKMRSPKGSALRHLALVSAHTTPGAQLEEPREPTIEELAAELLGCWVPPKTWSVDENDVVYLNDDEYKEAAAFWAQHGFSIERTGPLDSFMEGWAYLAAKPRKFIGYKTKYPKTYASQTKKWSKEDHEYLAALIANDLPQIARLAPHTIFARELREKMKTPNGSALRHLALISSQK